MFESFGSRLISLARRRGPTWRSTPWWQVESYRAKQESLLRLLAVAHEQRLDPTPLIRNLASEHRGAFRRRLFRLAARLESGTPLVSALEQTPDVMSDQDLLAIRFAIQSGTLAATYQSLLERPSDTWLRARTRIREFCVYGGTMVIVMSSLIAYMFAFVLPRMMQFGDELGPPSCRPLSLRWLFGTYDHAGWFIVLLLLVAVALAAFGLAPVRRFFTRRLAARLLSPVARLRTAEMLQMLSIATEAGRPVPASISTLARYHFDPNSRSKLLFARNEVEQGTDVWTSLADAKLLSSSEAHALAVATSNRSRSWTMRRLVQWKRQQVFQGTETAVMFARPFLTLIFAALVLTLCYSMFEFLTELIFGLA
ncbi:MAG: type II secretion system F family protein [Planctomycetaceae bacterium]